MFGRPNHSLSSQNQRKRFYDRGLADIVGADEYGSGAKANICLFDTPEANNTEACNSHADIWIG